MKTSGHPAFQTLQELRALSVQLEPLVVPAAVPRVSEIRNALTEFSVHASLVGQVKAGKSALANALVQQVGLLPSDVNPWTSAVTSIHVNTRKPDGNNAVFRFFDADDWRNMVHEGGRVAKMAKQASFDTEFSELRDQIKTLQERTESRLGKNFALLLGSQHAFSEFSSELIARYVCLGEEGAQSEREGRFADMTKSADLYVDLDAFEYPVTICDTPGVNDPFLVREAATLSTLGSSDLCVIVLNANQAFSSVDIALMRILLALDSDQIILFVNRIDELDDPATQVPEIEAYLRATLREQGLNEAIPVVFGSAAWAEAALSKDAGCLSEDSIQAFARMDMPQTRDVYKGLFDASGIAHLRRVLDQRAATCVVQPFVKTMASRLLDLAHQSGTILTQIHGDVEPAQQGVQVEDVFAKLDQVAEDIETGLDETYDALSQELLMRMSGVYNTFIGEETKALTTVLRGGGNLADWAPETAALSRDLHAEYEAITTQIADVSRKLTLAAAREIAESYDAVLSSDAERPDITFPEPISAQAPISLMRTMTIDLKTSWLKGWLRRKQTNKAYLDKLNAIVVEDMRAIITEIQSEYIAIQIEAQKLSLADFMSSHVETLRSLTDGKQERAAGEASPVSRDIHDRRLALAAAVSSLCDMLEVEMSLSTGQATDKVFVA